MRAICIYSFPKCDTYDRVCILYFAFFLFVSAGWWSVFIVFPIEDTQHRAFREILPMRQLSDSKMMKKTRMIKNTRMVIKNTRMMIKNTRTIKNTRRPEYDFERDYRCVDKYIEQNLNMKGLSGGRGSHVQ